MDVHAVLGEKGAGTTATALNLAVALRRDGHHAAVLDLAGDVTALLGVATGDVESLAAGGSVAAATVDAPLRVDGLEGALREYHEASTDDDTAFREGGTDDRPAESPDPGDGGDADGDLPVIVAGERSALVPDATDRLESLRADLAFAYDHVIVDAGRPEEGVLAFADGHLVVTTPGADAVGAARAAVVSCVRGGGVVVGSVINRADAATDVSAIRERTRTEVVGVVPGDARTPDLEPVAHTAPGTPAATAYGRLAGTIADWSGEGGVVGGGPDPEPELVADGDDGTRTGADASTTGHEDEDGSGGESSGHPFGGVPDDADDADDPDEEDGGGLLSRFF